HTVGVPRPLGSLLSCIVLCGCPEARSRGDDDPVPAGESGDGVVVGPQILTPGSEDRKSTRLNSSHVKISYAVFCLKKKAPVSRTQPRILNKGPPRHGARSGASIMHTTHRKTTLWHGVLAAGAAAR